MSALRVPSHRALLLVFAGLASVAMLIGSIAWLIDVTRSGEGRAGDGVVPAAGGGDRPAAGSRRFTLRLGQGFRFRDAAVVRGAEESPDVVFKYLPPQLGGQALRYNPVSQQVEQGLEPTLTSAVPLLVADHARTFGEKPDVGRITTGDMAAASDSAPIGTGVRYVLVQTRAGDQFLLTLDDLWAETGKYDDWRIGFAWEQVRLPLGDAEGRISKPLGGKLVFRDWYRTKMIVRVDLSSGKEEALADGILPSTAGEGLLAYGDPSNAYVVRDADGKALATIRFNEEVMGPLLSPEGSRVLGSVKRPGPPTVIGGMSLPSAPVPAVAVFDLAGKEMVSVPGYDDAAWAPDGKVIATGKYSDPGLFEIDLERGTATPIDGQVGAPSQPSVAPDGRTVAFVTGDRVWLIGRDGKDLRQLLPHAMIQQRPAFSPDGAKVALVICNNIANSLTGDVFVIDLATQEVTPIRTNTGSSLVPDTSTRLNWIR